MFDQKTVFILGAGASWHYGYPTGEDLVEMVIEKAKKIITILEQENLIFYYNYFTPLFLTKNIGSNFPTNLTHYDKERYLSVCKKIIQDCKKLVESLTLVKPLVIDNFLGQNPSLEEIGKFCIAWAILECEKIHHAHQGNINRRKLLQNSINIKEQKEASNIDLSKCKDDWCRFILHRLSQKPEKLIENKVSFITFNYDVSLERSLYTGLKCIEAFNQVEIDEFFSEKRFLHMYGKIHGSFNKPDPYLGSDYKVIKYQDKFIVKLKEEEHLFNQVYQCSQNIFTIEDYEKGNGNKNECQKTHEMAKTEISNAQKIYILGYGFDIRNSNRLGLPINLRDGSDKDKKRIYFTNFQDRNLINKKASDIFFKRLDRFLPPTYIQSPSSGNSKSFYIEKSNKDVYGALEMDFDFL